MRSWLMYQILKHSKVLTVETKIRGQKENENSSFYVGCMLYKASINFTIILEPGLLCLSFYCNCLKCLSTNIKELLWQSIAHYQILSSPGQTAHWCYISHVMLESKTPQIFLFYLNFYFTLNVDLKRRIRGHSSYLLLNLRSLSTDAGVSRR